MQPRFSPAGGRLKYANPEDLPSYPSLGLKKTDSAASAAASLGWASRRPPPSPPQSSTLSRPVVSSASAAAALFAHDGRMPSVAVSSESSNASLRAATLAARGQSPKRNLSGPPLVPLSNNAASKAFNTDRSSPKPSLRKKPRKSRASGLNRQGSSILAAPGVTPDLARPRAQSSPLTRGSHPAQQTAAANALSAAALAHRPAAKSFNESGAVPYTTMPRSMFTASPTMKPGIDEQKKHDKLHSDAVAMARKIYTQQQAMFDEAKKAPGGDHSTPPPSPGVTSLQDTAYKLAQQRLLKRDEDGQKNRDYQDYYGAMSPTSRRFGARRVLRRRASSDSEIVAMQDRYRSETIRKDSSIFNNKATQVDEKKRTEDRQALIALAQKNVQAQLAMMDSKITEETGWVNPSVKNERELKAQAAVRQTGNERSGVAHRGQVDIGGGKYMDIKAVEEIAERRMRPVLDDINEKAQRERERLERLKTEQEAKRKGVEVKKAKEREVREHEKKQKDYEKHEERDRKEKEKQQERDRRDREKQDERVRRELHKQDERQRKEEERAKRDEEKSAKLVLKKQAKEERLRTRELAAAAKALKRQQQTHSQGHATDDNDDDEDDDNDVSSDTDGSSSISSRPSTRSSHHHPQLAVMESAGNLKTWLKTRLVRPRGRSNASATTSGSPATAGPITTDQGENNENMNGYNGENLLASSDNNNNNNNNNSRPSTRGESGFVGGATLMAARRGGGMGTGMGMGMGIGMSESGNRRRIRKRRRSLHTTQSNLSYSSTGGGGGGSGSSSNDDSMVDIAFAGRGDHDFLREGESEIPISVEDHCFIGVVDGSVSPLSSDGGGGGGGEGGGVGGSDEEFPTRRGNDRQLVVVPGGVVGEGVMNGIPMSLPNNMLGGITRNDAATTIINTGGGGGGGGGGNTSSTTTTTTANKILGTGSLPRDSRFQEMMD